MSEKVLFVDDDPNILAAYQRTLRKLFQIDTARGGELGLAAIAQHGPYAVIVTDMQMPQMDGVQFLRRAQELAPDSVRMMLTGNADQHTAIEAVNAGRIFRFMNKPCPPEQFTQTLQDGIRQYRLIHAEKELLEKTLSGSVRVLTEILSVVDPQSFGYAETLKRSMRPLAEALKVAEVWEWEIAAMLSQIGYVTIPPAVIGKARSGKELAEVEAKMLLRVPEIGHHLLANIPRLESVARIVLYQNKRFDGVGFPADAVAGEQIPLAARVLKIVSDLAQIEVQKIPRARAFEMMAGRAGWYDDRAGSVRWWDGTGWTGHVAPKP